MPDRPSGVSDPAEVEARVREAVEGSLPAYLSDAIVDKTVANVVAALDSVRQPAGQREEWRKAVARYLSHYRCFTGLTKPSEDIMAIVLDGAEFDGREIMVSDENAPAAQERPGAGTRKDGSDAG